VEIVVAKDDRALHEVLDDGLAREWRAEAQRMARPPGRGRREVATRTVVGRALARLHCRFAACLELLGRAPAAVGATAREERASVLGIERVPLALEERPLVPVEAEPPEPLQVLVHRGLGRSLAVGVLEPEHETTAVMAREEPVEEGRARAADVQVAGGTGREPRADLHAGRLTGRVPHVKLAASRRYLSGSTPACILPLSPPGRGAGRRVSRWNVRRFSWSRTTRTIAASSSIASARSASSRSARPRTASRRSPRWSGIRLISSSWTSRCP